MPSGAGRDNRTDASPSQHRKEGLICAGGAALMIGLVVAALAMLTSPDGWTMKAANQAMQDHQQAIAANYLTKFGE